MGVRMQRLPADLGDGEERERNRGRLDLVGEHDPGREEDEDIDGPEQHEVEDDDRRRAEPEDREGSDLQPVVERRLGSIAGLQRLGDHHHLGVVEAERGDGEEAEDAPAARNRP